MVKKESLFVGQRLEIANKNDLPSVNDNYQNGLWLEYELNTETRDRGLVVSGELDPDYPVIIVSLCEDAPEIIAVSCRRRTGRLDPVQAFATLETLDEFFILS